MLIVFVLSSFLAAALLFLVEPLLGRLVLPTLGGSPAVWTTCMVFFQLVLLAAYGYAHLCTRRLRPRGQALVHAGVIIAAAISLPLSLPPHAALPAGGMPFAWLLRLLAVAAGLPFFAVAATAPLVQHWFSRTSHRRAHDPYFLYAAGNLGSVVGLLAYPLLCEPLLGVRAQGVAWSLLYAVLAPALLACAVLAGRGGAAGAPHVPPGRPVAPRAEAPTMSSRLRWLALAAVPSSLTLGVTQYVSTDLAAIPLAWVVPLLVYLLTWVAAFSPRVRLPSRALAVALMLVAPAAGGLLALAVARPIVPLIALHLAGLATASLVCHGRLAATRPGADHLTGFYFLVALGGALGGLFNAVAAPLLFNSVLEYPLALLGACLLAPLGGWPGPRAASARPGARLLRWWRPAAVVVLACGFVLLARHASVEPGVRILSRTRTFFGVHEVSADDNDWFVLKHGTTLHGIQSHYTDPHTGFYWGRKPAAYYHDTGPIGDVFRVFFRQAKTGRVAVVGLGAGSLAGYAFAGQQFDFYEIDPEVARIAANREWFTYLADARARGALVDVILGDGRLSLAGRTGPPYGVIVLDAFSSDAIPVHLLTREAVAVYRDQLAGDGLLAFHISNRFFDFRPVLAAIARDLGLVAWFRDDARLTQTQRIEGKRASWWVILARRDSDLGPLTQVAGWEPLASSARVPVWTDDHANLLGVFRPSGLSHRGD